MTGTIKDKNKPGITRKLWQRTARGRLRFELGGLAFAIEKGSSPEEYARHLWGKGATTWIGQLGLLATIGPEADGIRCILRIRRD